MIKVFLVSSGLGHIKRGLESFTQEFFETFLTDDFLDVTLFRGAEKSSNSSKEIVLGNLSRYNRTTILLSKLFKEPQRRDPHFLEQFSFFISLLPHLHLKKPDVIFFSEANLGTFLWHWRRLTKQSYKLLYNNGGPCKPSIFYRWDHIRQVAPTHIKAALEAGIPAEKQTLVLDGINVPSELQTLTASEREALRHRLGLPEKRPLLLSVAAINKSHKRMDYLIREIASLPEPRPYLLLLGQQSDESPELFQLGNELLGTNHFQIRTVAQKEVADYYKVADVFVLASLREGLPRVILEAMSYGLPCLMHDYEIARFALGDEGYFANFELRDSLANLVPKALAESHDISKRRLRHHAIYERYSWEKIRSDYIKLIQKCTN
jgi:glycosyltransferase involved in cell wall biosynthesis